jgi:hypothetical protein
MADAAVYVHVIGGTVHAWMCTVMGMAVTVHDMMTRTVHAHGIGTVHGHGVWALFNVNSDYGSLAWYIGIRVRVDWDNH